MVTVKKFLKMLNADEQELKQIIDNMSEADAKAYLLSLIGTMQTRKSAGFTFDIPSDQD